MEAMESEEELQHCGLRAGVLGVLTHNADPRESIDSQDCPCYNTLVRTEIVESSCRPVPSLTCWQVKSKLFRRSQLSGINISQVEEISSLSVSYQLF